MGVSQSVSPLRSRVGSGGGWSVSGPIEVKVKWGVGQSVGPLRSRSRLGSGGGRSVSGPIEVKVKVRVKVFNVHIQSRKEGRKEMFHLTTHSTHFIYGYMASDIWLRTILIVRKETHYRHIGCSFRLTARVLLYALSHRQDGLCDTSHGALAGTRNSSMGPPHEGSIRRPIAPFRASCCSARLSREQVPTFDLCRFLCPPSRLFISRDCIFNFARSGVDKLFLVFKF